MANDIDLGELQDKLESAEKNHKRAATNMQRAFDRYALAVDNEALWKQSVDNAIKQVRMATFTLTRKVLHDTPHIVWYTQSYHILYIVLYTDTKGTYTWQPNQSK